MGRRCEPRTAISFPILVRGFDSHGTPFAIATETCDVSHAGASIKGLENLVQPGNKIEIEYKDQKAWCRVQWIGKNGSSKAGRVGVRCLERKYMWDVPAATWDKDPYNEVPATSSNALGWDGKERRLFGRRPCRIEAQVSIPGSLVRLDGKVTDVSLGGCYVEMLAPLPIDTSVELVLTTGDIVLRASGKVRSSQAGLGMGIAFTIFGPGEFEKLRRLAPPSTAPGVSKPTEKPSSPSKVPPSESNFAPALPSALHRLPTTAQVLEAVIRILLRKNLFSREDLAMELETLQRLKNSE
jgi:hypothetical protein